VQISEPISLRGNRSYTLTADILPKTSVIEVRIKRPTAAAPLNWDATLKVRVAVLVDGAVHYCEGQVTGGIRTRVLTGSEMPEYVLRYVPTYGFFGDRQGLPKRIGETSTVSYKIGVDITVLRGTRCDSQIQITTFEADAPAVAFHSSVAFDAATDGQELGGDGVLSISHTATGADRAAFAGITWAGNGGASSTSCTYGGSGMTEMWDLNNSTFYYNAGYRIAAPATGSQAVVSTLSDGGPDEQALGVVTFTGVDQTTPVGTPQTAAAGTGTTATVTVASVGANDMVVDCLNIADPTGLSIGANQDLRNSEGLAGTSMRQSTQLGSAGGVMSWTWTNNTVNLLGAVNFKEASAGKVTKNTRSNPLGVEVGMGWRIH
jgi:hypothetical protein